MEKQIWSIKFRFQTLQILLQMITNALMKSTEIFNFQSLMRSSISLKGQSLLTISVNQCLFQLKTFYFEGLHFEILILFMELLLTQDMKQKLWRTALIQDKRSQGLKRSSTGSSSKFSLSKCHFVALQLDTQPFGMWFLEIQQTLICFGIKVILSGINIQFSSLLNSLELGFWFLQTLSLSHCLSHLKWLSLSKLGSFKKMQIYTTFD